MTTYPGSVKSLLQLTQAQINNLEAEGGVTQFEVVDTATDIEALTAAQIASLEAIPIDQILVTDNSVALTVAQATALEKGNVPVSAPAGDTVTLSDTVANLESLTATQLSGLSGLGATAVTAADTAANLLSLTGADTAALASVNAAVGGTGQPTYLVVDTPADIEALTAAQIGMLQALPARLIDSSGSVNLTTAQALALEAGHLTVTAPAGDVVTLSDTVANLESLTAAQLSGLSGLGATAVTAADTAANLLSLTGADTAALAQVNAAVGGSGQPAYVVVDTAENVSANFDALNADPSISAIDMTDSGTLMLDAEQALDDTTAEGAVAKGMGYVDIAVVDSAANISANLAALTADPEVISIDAVIADPASFSGPLPDLPNGGAIDLRGVTISSASVSGDQLTLTVADPSTLTYTLNPNQTGDAFVPESDGNGGTLLVQYDPASVQNFTVNDWGSLAAMNEAYVLTYRTSGNWDAPTNWWVTQGSPATGYPKSDSNYFFAPGFPGAGHYAYISASTMGLPSDYAGPTPTVTFNSTDAVAGLGIEGESYYAGYPAPNEWIPFDLDMAGGSLTVLGELVAGDEGTINQTGGHLTVENIDEDGFGTLNYSSFDGTGSSDTTFNQMGGDFEIDNAGGDSQGFVDFYYGNVDIGATVSGSGELLIDEDTTLNLNPGADLTVASLTLENFREFAETFAPTMNLNTDVFYAGDFVNDDGIVNLNNDTLTLAGTVNAGSGAVFNGPGGLDIEGEAATSDLTINGDVTLTDGGYIQQQDDFVLTGTLNIQIGGIWNISDDSSIGTTDSLTIDNAGLFRKSGGNDDSSINADTFTSTGTIEVDSGVLEFSGAVQLGGYIVGYGTVGFIGSQTVSSTATVSAALDLDVNNVLTINASGALDLEGAGNEIDGGVDGAGQLNMTNGSFDLAPGLSLAVSAWSVAGGGGDAQVNLSTNLDYAGAFTAGAGADLELNGYTLTLNPTGSPQGPDLAGRVDGGGGVLILGGGTDGTGDGGDGASLGPGLIVSGATVEAQGYLAQIGGLTLNADTNGNAAELQIQTGATYYMGAQAPGAAAITGDAVSSVVNDGTIAVNGGGVADLDAPFVNDDDGGELLIFSGNTLYLDGGYSYGGSTDFGGYVGGPGDLSMETGGFALDANLQISVGTWELAYDTAADVANIVLGDDLSYGGTFLDGINGNIDLDGFSFILAGVSTDLQGVLYGPTGSLIVAGVATVDGMVVADNTVFEAQGTVTQTDDLKLGLSVGDAAELKIDSGANYTLVNATVTDGSGTSTTQVDNSGTLHVVADVNGGDSLIDSPYVGSGEIEIDAFAKLVFTASTGAFGGSVSGAGDLSMETGDFALASGLQMSVATWELANTDADVAEIELATDLTYGGTFFDGKYGSIQLKGFSLTLSGVGSYLQGVLSGPTGSLIVAGQATVDDLQVAGDAVLEAQGTVTQANNLQLGLSADDTAELKIDSGANYTLANGAITDGSGTATTQVDNSGTLQVLTGFGGDDSQIATAYVGSGEIEIDAAATLVLTGSSSAFGGSVSGAGDLSMKTGAFVLDSGLQMSVATWEVASAEIADVADIELGTDLTYGGTFLDGSSGTIDLNDFSLTLSGVGANLHGVLHGPTGSLIVAGGATVDDLQVADNTVFEAQGTVTQGSDLKLGLSAGDAAELKIDSGANYTLANATITDGSGTATTQVDNSGTLQVVTGVSGDDSQIATPYVGDGEIEIDTGAKLVFTGGSSAFGGSVSGAGDLSMETGGFVLYPSFQISVATWELASAGEANISLATGLTYGGAFLDGSHGSIDLNGFSLTLSGTGSNLQGVLHGPTGSLIVAGGATVDSLTAADNTVFEVQGIVTQTNFLRLGVDANDAAELKIDPGANYTLANASITEGSGTATTLVDNSGLLQVIAGFDGDVSQIDAAYGGSGDIDIGAGATLVFTGGSSAFGGPVSGPGELDMTAGSYTLDDGLDVSVAQWTIGNGAADPTETLAGDVTVTGGFTEDSDGEIDLDDHTLTLNGATDLEGVVKGPGVLEVDGQTTLSGLVLDSGATATFGVSTMTTLTNSGETTVNAGGALTIEDPVSAGGATGDFLLGAGATLTFGAAVADDQTIAFGAGDAATLQVDDFANDSGTLTQDFNATIAGFDQNGTIALAASGLGVEAAVTAATPGAYDDVDDTTPVALTDDGDPVGTMQFNGDYSGWTFTVTPNFGAFDLTAAPCYCRGTLIQTDRGEVPIENLRVGDLAVTASGALRPIIWIGHRRTNCARHPRPATVWPIRIMAGAFAENVPHQDLHLSPDHAVFVDAVLIPIKHLINGATIKQEPRDDVTYYHVELPQHDIIFAEGVPAESYLDTGDRSKLSSGGGVITLHPDFSALPPAMIWEAKACAELVVTGPILAAVRARLLQRSAELAVKTARRRGINATSVEQRVCIFKGSPADLIW